MHTKNEGVMRPSIYSSPLRKKKATAVVSPSVASPLFSSKTDKETGDNDDLSVDSHVIGPDETGDNDDLSVDSNVLEQEFPSDPNDMEAKKVPQNIGVTSPTMVVDGYWKAYNALVPLRETVFPPPYHEFLRTQQVFTYGVVTRGGPEEQYWDKPKETATRVQKHNPTYTTPKKGKGKRTNGSSTPAAPKMMKLGSDGKKIVSPAEQANNAKRSGRNMNQTQLVETNNYKLQTAKASRVNQDEYRNHFMTKPEKTINRVHQRLLQDSASRLITKEDEALDSLLTGDDEDNLFSNNPYLKLQEMGELRLADSLQELENGKTTCYAMIRPCLWISRINKRYTDNTKELDFTGSCNCLAPLVKAAHGIHDQITNSEFVTIMNEFEEIRVAVANDKTGRSKELSTVFHGKLASVKNQNVRDGLWALRGVDMRPSSTNSGIPRGMLPLCMMGITLLVGTPEKGMRNTMFEERKFSINFVYGCLGGYSKKVKSLHDKARGDQDLAIIPGPKKVLSTGEWYKQEGYRETMYRNEMFQLCVCYQKQHSKRVLVNEPPMVPPTNIAFRQWTAALVMPHSKSLLLSTNEFDSLFSTVKKIFGQHSDQTSTCVNNRMSAMTQKVTTTIASHDLAYIGPHGMAESVCILLKDNPRELHSTSYLNCHAIAFDSTSAAAILRRTTSAMGQPIPKRYLNGRASFLGKKSLKMVPYHPGMDTYLTTQCCWEKLGEDCPFRSLLGTELGDKVDKWLSTTVFQVVLEDAGVDLTDYTRSSTVSVKVSYCHSRFSTIKKERTLPHKCYTDEQDKKLLRSECIPFTVIVPLSKAGVWIRLFRDKSDTHGYLVYCDYGSALVYPSSMLQELGRITNIGGNPHLMMQVIEKPFQDEPSPDEFKKLQAAFLGYQTKQERTYSHIPKTVEYEKEKRGQKWETGLRMVTPQMRQVHIANPETEVKNLKNLDYYNQEPFKREFEFLESQESTFVDRYLAC